VRRLGVRFLLDPYTSKPNVRLYTYARVGGAVNNSEAVKLLNFTA
jgi:HK97 family phage major capsid protein